MGWATVILDSVFWKRGRINVVTDARFCMYVAAGCRVVDVLWCRERDITTLPWHVGFTPPGIRRLHEETFVESIPKDGGESPLPRKYTKNPREERVARL